MRFDNKNILKISKIVENAINKNWTNIKASPKHIKKGMYPYAAECEYLRCVQKIDSTGNYDHPPKDHFYGDIYSKIRHNGLEIKTCFIWEGNTYPEWRNGSNKDPYIKKNTILVCFAFDNDQNIYIKELYYGPSLYNYECNYQSNYLRIGHAQLNDLLKRKKLKTLIYIE